MRRFGPRRQRFSGYDKPVDCPEGRGSTCADCLGCDQYQVWREGDGPRCQHEFRELKSQGYYKPGEEGWTGYLSNADPETYERLRDEEKTNRRACEWLEEEQRQQEAEAERWHEEMKRHAREYEKEQEKPDEEREEFNAEVSQDRILEEWGEEDENDDDEEE